LSSIDAPFTTDAPPDGTDGVPTAAVPPALGVAGQGIAAGVCAQPTMARERRGRSDRVLRTVRTCT
jgi:hypothetical protein